MTGIPETLKELQLLEEKISSELKHAVQESDKHTFGADRWVTHLGWKLAHIRTIIKIKKDDSLPDGTIIRVPVMHDPSPVRIALAEKCMNTEIDKEASAKKEQILTSDISIAKLLGFS